MRPASFGQRALGSFVDALVTGAVWGLLVAMAPSDDPRRYAPISIAIAGLYHVVAIGWRGRTIGKWLGGTTVVADVAGRHPTPPGWPAAGIRWAVLGGVGLVPGVGELLGGVVVLVALIGILTDPLGRGIHDRLAGTRVIDARGAARSSWVERQRAAQRTEAPPSRRRHKRHRGPVR